MTIRATVKAWGQQREKHFPDGTPKRTIDDWKDRERGRIKNAVPPASRGTLTQDVDRYLATLVDRRPLLKERTYQLDWWLLRFGTRARHDLTAAEIRAALAELRLTKAASTCNHYRMALAHLWTTLDGKDGKNPLRNVPAFVEPESEPRDLPHGLVARILDAMPDMGAGVPKGQKRSRVSLGKLRLRVIFTTGLSPAEMMRLRPRDLYLDVPAVYVQRRQKGKGAEGMMFPLTAEGTAAIKDFADHHAFGKFSTHGVRQSWVKACQWLREQDSTTDEERAILRTARPYDLRHTFGTHVLRKTQDLKTTQELMRHRSSKTTKRYTRGAIPEHLRLAVEAMAGMPAETLTGSVANGKTLNKTDSQKPAASRTKSPEIHR